MVLGYPIAGNTDISTSKLRYPAKLMFFWFSQNHLHERGTNTSTLLNQCWSNIYLPSIHPWIHPCLYLYTLTSTCMVSAVVFSAKRMGLLVSGVRLQLFKLRKKNSPTSKLDSLWIKISGNLFSETKRMFMDVHSVPLLKPSSISGLQSSRIQQIGIPMKAAFWRFVCRWSFVSNPRVTTKLLAGMKRCWQSSNEQSCYAWDPRWNTWYQTWHGRKEGFGMRYVPLSLRDGWELRS